MYQLEPESAMETKLKPKSNSLIGSEKKKPEKLRMLANGGLIYSLWFMRLYSSSRLIERIFLLSESSVIFCSILFFWLRDISIKMLNCPGRTSTQSQFIDHLEMVLLLIRRITQAISEAFHIQSKYWL